GIHGRLSVVHALLDRSYHRGILRLQAVPQRLASGQHFGTADEHRGLYHSDPGLWAWHVFYETSDAKILLLPGICAVLPSDDGTKAFFPVLRLLRKEAGRR